MKFDDLKFYPLDGPGGTLIAQVILPNKRRGFVLQKDLYAFAFDTYDHAIGLYDRDEVEDWLAEHQAIKSIRRPVSEREIERAERCRAERLGEGRDLEEEDIDSDDFD